METHAYTYVLCFLGICTLYSCSGQKIARLMPHADVVNLNTYSAGTREPVILSTWLYIAN